MRAARTGRFGAPAAGAKWAKTQCFAGVLTNQTGKASYPITGAAFILMYTSQADAAKEKEALKIFNWAHKNDGALAPELHYVTMPSLVLKLVEDAWKLQLKD